MNALADGTALYRVRGEAGLLLYIGISDNFGRRWREHAKKQPWWPEMRSLSVDEWFADRADAEAAEIAAIKAEKPKYNKRHLVPVQRKPEGASLVAAAPAPEERVPYPYSLLSFRLPEPDLGGTDLATLEGTLIAAAHFSAYERRASEVRSRLDARIAWLLELEQACDMDWAWPAIGRMRSGLESLVGDGVHLATGRGAVLRAVAVLRENEDLSRKLADATGVIADAYEAGDAVNDFPERGAA